MPVGPREQGQRFEDDGIPSGGRRPDIVEAGTNVEIRRPNNTLGEIHNEEQHYPKE